VNVSIWAALAAFCCIASWLSFDWRRGATAVRERGHATAPRRIPRERRRTRDYHFGTHLAGTLRLLPASIGHAPRGRSRMNARRFFP
jgi:hypothetical protein